MIRLHFWPSVEIDARVLSGRFLLGGGVGRDFVVDLRTREKVCRINRPRRFAFNSSILAAAELTGPAGP